MTESVTRVSQLSQSSGQVPFTRTNEPTDTEGGSVTMTFSRNAPRAGGRKESSTGSGHNAARADLLTVQPDFTSTGCACPSIDAGARRGCLYDLNAQDSSGAPLTHEHVVSCTNSATRHTETAFVAVPRHRFIEAACPPVARWHGESDGSNPLRPPADRPAASRCGGRLSLTTNSRGRTTDPRRVVGSGNPACLDAASWPDEIEATGKFGLAWARTGARSWRAAS